MNTGVHVSLSVPVSSACMPSSGICWEARQSYPQDFKESSLFSIVAVYQFCTPADSVRGFSFSIPGPAFIMCRLFDDGHSDNMR